MIDIDPLLREAQLLREVRCSVDNCNGERDRRGLCSKHYLRQWRGVPLLTTRELFIQSHPPVNGIGLIPLPTGEVVTVDEEDYIQLIGHCWAIGGRGYAMRHDGAKIVYLHRSIMGFPKLQVDHIDRDKMNNRRSNLRLCTNMQNQMNKYAPHGRSRYKGVHRNKRNSCWTASIVVQGRNRYLASCQTEEDAATYYDVAAQLFFGEFASINHV